MSYFNLLPNIEYDKKPLTFPYSETEYVLVKNFFKRYKLSESSFNYNTMFSKYLLTDHDRLDIVSNNFYNTPEYDWIIAITNNILNIYFDLPKPEKYLYDMVNEVYKNSTGNQLYPADRIHHYETIEFKNSNGNIVVKNGINVDSNFYNSPYKYYNNGNVLSISGNIISKPITNYEYEKTINDKRREIYILKPQYIQDFIKQFEEGMPYSKSSSYINKNTKLSGL